MVRIPLVRRQPKEGPPQGKDGKSKEVKKTPLPSDTVHFRGLQSQKPESAVGTQPSLPASAPDRDQPARPQWAGTGKKLPFPLKSPDEEEVTPSPKAPPVEKTAISLTPPEKGGLLRMDSHGTGRTGSVPGAPSSASGSVATQTESDIQINWPPKPVQPMHVADGEADESGSVAFSVPAVSEPLPAQAESEAEISPPEPVEPLQVVDETGGESDAAKSPLPGQSELPNPTEDAAGTVGAPSKLDGTLNHRQVDGLAILQAMPDYILRIGQDGITLVAGNGSRTDGKDEPKPLDKIIIEELARQSRPHVEKVLETKQLQTFEFQVRDEKEAHDLEVRLTPLFVERSEVLALVRDVTLLRQTYNALIESRNELENHLKDRNAELIRVNKMLKTEVELRIEQEEILKKNFHRLEGLLEDTIGAITLMVERRDPHIADHERRVSQLACAIGQEMKLRNDQMRAVRMAAQLHDVGKIFIPAEILRKPGKLTEAEKSVIRTHPDTDYQILKRIDFPISIADVVRQHHERMNGSGYPQGLKGDEILLEARIIGVADVVEGMLFERPYRTAPGLEAALKELAANKGTLYDPVVTDACIKLFAEKSFKFETLPGQETVGSTGQVIDRRDF